MKSQDAYGKPGGMEYVRAPVESEAKWQRHVMAALWTILALAFAIGTVLFYAETQGWFQPAPAHASSASLLARRALIFNSMPGPERLTKPIIAKISTRK